jgi:hypothetical protein
MISPQEKLSVFKNQTLNLSQIRGGDSTIVSKPDRVKPELALPVWRPHVDVRRLARFIGVEVKPVTAYPQNRGHNASGSAGTR